MNHSGAGDRLAGAVRQCGAGPALTGGAVLLGLALAVVLALVVRPAVTAQHPS